MREIEVDGKTVTLAVEKGLAELSLRRDQVEVQVLQEANPGFLGLGQKMARVRIREKIWGTPSPDQPTGDKPSPRGRPARETSTQPRQPRTAGEDTNRPSTGLGPRRSGRTLPRHALLQNNVAPPPPDTHTDQEPKTERPSYQDRPQRSNRDRGDNRGGDRGNRGGDRRPPYGGRRSDSYSAPKLPPAEPLPESERPKACTEAKSVIEELFGKVGIEGLNVATSWDDKQERVRADLESTDTELLLSQAGKVLESLQFLTTLMLSRRMKQPVAVQIETGGYWKEKEDDVIRQVHEAIEMLNRTSRPVRMKPMDATLRRLVHRTLASHPDIETASEGEGSWRKVVLKPKRSSK